jgi:predicted secreted protein
MKWTSALAIYLLFWVMSAFFVMPFGMKTADEAGIAKVRGQADSAPANFSGRKILLRTTIVATLAFALYYANYVNGWFTVDDINIVRLLRPAS